MDVAHRTDHERIVITGSNLGKLYWIRQEIGLVGKAPVKNGIIPCGKFDYLSHARCHGNISRLNSCRWRIEIATHYSLRSMAVFCRAGRTSGEAAKFAREARENERRSREKNKNRLPGFEGFLTAAPFTSF